MAAAKKNHPSLLPHTKSQENDKLESIKKPIESKFSQIEERFSSVEQQIKSQKLEFVSLIRKIEELTKTALNIGYTNSKLKITWII